MPKVIHSSSCPITKLPANWPMPCQCEAKFAPKSGTLWSHMGYSRIAAARNFAQLCKYRIFYLYENLAILGRFRLLFGKRSR